MRVLRSLARGFSVLIGVGMTLGLVGFVGSPAVAQTASVGTSANDRWTVETDKSRRPGNKPYFIEFRGRAAATYGHMYVLYGRVNARDEIVESRIAGLHPAGDAENCANCSLFNWTVGHAILVPAETGASDGDLEEKYVTARFRVWMDKTQYQELDRYIRKLQADSPLWNALFNNCVGFGRNIANHMGLEIPGFVWLEPQDFVNSLRELNGVKKEQLPLRDASAASARASSRTPPLPPQKPKAEPTAGGPSASVLPKPAPAKPKKPVAQNAATQTVASGDVH